MLPTHSFSKLRRSASLAALCLLFAPVSAFATHPIPAVNLTCSAVGDEVTLTWTASSDALAPVVVTRDGVDIGTVELLALSFVDEGVNDGEHLYSLVERLTWGGFVEINVLAGCRVTVERSLPFDLECEAITSPRSVHLEWKRVELNAAIVGYRVLRGDLFNESLIEVLLPDSTEYLDLGENGPPFQTTNRFVIYADLETGGSVLVGVCEVELPPTPRQVVTCALEARALIEGRRVVTVAWCPSLAPGGASFTVFRNDERAGETGDCAYTDASLPGPGVYEYRVRLVVGAPDGSELIDDVPLGDCSVFAPPCCDGSAPPAPQDLACQLGTVANGTAIEIGLTWRNAAAYDLIVVSRDGEPIALLAGAMESHSDMPAVEQDRYVYDVVGVLGNVSEPARCTVEADGGDPPPRFLRGDGNGDGSVDLSDAVFTLSWLFQGGAPPECAAAANPNGDGEVDISDPVSLLQHLFQGGPPPAEPYPECGPGLLAVDEALGCASTSEDCQEPHGPYPE